MTNENVIKQADHFNIHFSDGNQWGVSALRGNFVSHLQAKK